MNKFINLFKVEWKIGLRCPDTLIFGIGMPVGVLFLIAVIAGDMVTSDGNTFLQSAFASLLTVGICATAFMGLPLTLADYRDKKILKHFFVTPASPMLLLWVQVCKAMVIAIISSVLVAAASVFIFNYRMDGNIFLFILAYFLVMLAMYSIGMVIASLCRNIKITNVVTTFIYFPMLFLSGATIPYELFPNTIQVITNILPLTHGIKLLKAISLGLYTNDLWISIALLIFFIIAGTIISIVSFKWE